ncbi:MAG: hypothetical protein CMP47_16070 [Rickettsiales bacterium]|jgi:ABC-type cobalt transport system substrate-binding protein|nr:hypothetical protein [Rickettsiales bacterium]
MSSTANRSLIWLLTVTAILAIPLIAMQFTQEVNWGITDFIVAAALLAGGALFYELIIRRYMRTSTSKLKTILFTLGLISLILLVWLELAVGILGTPFAGS